ncbi:MAG: ankyrin repeat domain-containing protein [Pirellulales bacterium]
MAKPVGHLHKDKSALFFATTKGNGELVDVLKDAGAQGDPVPIRLTNELIQAACRGFEMVQGEGFSLYPGVVRDLDGAPDLEDVIQAGGNVNWARPNGYTPRMYAANLGLIENVKTLLANGADVKLASTTGDTAISLHS